MLYHSVRKHLKANRRRDSKDGPSIEIDNVVRQEIPFIYGLIRLRLEFFNSISERSYFYTLIRAIKQKFIKVLRYRQFISIVDI